MGTCENLATKQDINELKALLEGLAKKQDVEEAKVALLQSDAEGFGATIAAIQAFFGEVAKILQALSFINDIIKAIWDWIFGKEDPVMNKLDEIFTLLQQVDSYVKDISTLLNYLYASFVAFVGALYGELKYIKDAADFIAAFLDKFYQEWVSAHYALVNQINDLQALLLEALERLAQTLSESLQAIYNDLVNRLEKLASDVKSWIDEAFSKVEKALDNLKNYIEGIYKWLEARVNEIIDLLSQIPKEVNLDLSPVINAIEQFDAEVSGKLSDLDALVAYGTSFLNTAITTLTNTEGFRHQEVINKLNALLAEERSPLIARIYQILGGGAWFDENGALTGIEYNPFEQLEAKYQALSSSEEAEGKYTVLNLPRYVQSVVAATYGRLGLQDYPVTVPTSLTGKSNDTLALPHLTRFQSWQTKQLDALLGQYPIEIDIEDSDLVKVGSQKLKVKLPNVAESLAEIMGLLITTRGLADASVNVGIRTLSELGVTRETVTKGYYKTEAIEDYLGYELKRKTIVVPHFFNPHGEKAGDPVENLSDFLKLGKTDLEIEEYAENKGLEFKLTTLLEAARIIKAHFWRSVSLDENSFKDQMNHLLRRGEEATSKADEALNKESDFDAYLEEVEQGFTGKAGIKDPVNPYGRPYDQRPKITEIGVQAPNDGGGGQV